MINKVKIYRVFSNKVDTIAQRLKTTYQNQSLTQQLHYGLSIC